VTQRVRQVVASCVESGDGARVGRHVAMVDGEVRFNSAEHAVTAQVVALCASRVAHHASGGEAPRAELVQVGGSRWLVETLTPSRRVVLVGAGHDVMPVAALCSAVGWDTHVVDWRPGLLTSARFPSATLTVSGPETLPARLPLEPGVAAVVMAHHLGYDSAALEVLLRDERVRSVGLLGPRHRASKVLEAVGARGALTEAQRAKLRAPVGLELGAEGPQLIALSIVAELQQVFSGASGLPRSLKSPDVARVLRGSL
jgi:xanthine dehydrogenase accessory factor